MFSSFLGWLDQAPLILIGVLLMACMTAAAIGSHAFRLHQERQRPASKDDRSQEGYVVSATLGLLALFLGFTFSLVTDRFETRRHLVMEEANAIGTAFLQSQLLPEPHRSRLSHILVAYTENKIVLAKADGAAIAPLLADDDRLLTDIWAATAAGFDATKNLAFSNTFVSSINDMLDLDASRRAQRSIHVPTEVFAMLLTYLVVSAGVVGYVLSAPRGRLAGLFLMALLTLSLLLLIDIDRPVSGGIHEFQHPMEQLLISLKSQPASVYDRWRTAPVTAPAHP